MNKPDQPENPNNIKQMESMESMGLKIRTNDEDSIFHIYHTAKLFASGGVEVDTSLSDPDFNINKDEAAGCFRISDGTTEETYPGLEKEDCKRAVFAYLSAKTGKIIPWGTLIGVRPTKIATSRLKLGESQAAVRRYLKETYFVTDEKISLAIEVAKREAELLGAFPKGQIGIYIDMPFCPTKCFYCSFLSYPSGNTALMEKYHQTLLKDIEATGNMIKAAGLIPGYLYFGGGTPTSPGADRLREILQAVGEHLMPTGGGIITEYTVEAGRPDTITEEKLLLMKAAGVTRLSINPQTFNDHTLEKIGRTHTGGEIKAAFAMARRIGFSEINMDLILGLPGETVADVTHSIRSACQLAPENITIHGLAIKKGSQMAGTRTLSEAQVPAMYEAAYGILAQNGYEPYYLYRNKNTLANMENVGFTKPGHANRYNIAMIEETDSIIASGASGISRVITDERSDKGNRIIRRHSGYKDIYQYLDHFEELMASKALLVDLASKADAGGRDEAANSDLIQD